MPPHGYGHSPTLTDAEREDARSADLGRIARLFRPYRRRLVLVLSMIVVSAGLGMLSPFLLKEILDTAIPDRDTGLLTMLVGGMIFVAVATGVIGVGQTWLSNVVGQRVMHDLRIAVYRHLQRMSLAFFTRTRTGEVQSRIANDIGGVQNVVTSTATQTASNLTTVLATVAALLVLDWRLALFSFALLPIFIGITRRVGEERKRITAKQQGSKADMSALVEESLSISGILLGKSMGRSEDLTERFRRESHELAGLEVLSKMAGRWRMASVQISFAVMPALVYLFAGWTLANGSDTVSVGTLVAFTTLQTRLFFPVQSLLNVGIEVQSSLALFHRVFEYLDLPVDIEESDDPVDLGDARGRVRFEAVDFGYDDVDVLRGVDLVVEPGRTLAVVGATGAGKTTLAYLVARLYDPRSGRITIDDVDVRDVSFDSLRRTVGLVSQDTYLFHASIRENLRFAKPDASDDELEAACRAARVHDLVVSLPAGYDTHVGERGYRFSGGEKQRLAIARCILRNPPVLILDEATSALDNRTEGLVQAALDDLSEHRTTIAIAHRLSTVRRADEIIVLDAGRVVESGTHEELLALGARYARLHGEIERDEADA